MSLTVIVSKKTLIGMRYHINDLDTPQQFTCSLNYILKTIFADDYEEQMPIYTI
jgi:hypothetical protein